jgi:hypothetical protein
MKFKSRLAAAAIAVAFPLGAGAMPVLWEFSGHLDAVTGAVGIPIAAGDAFSIDVGFDTGAALQNQLGGRYRYDPSSITFSIRIDGLGPFNSSFNPSAGGTFFLRNDAVPPDAGPPLVDGMSFGLNDFNDAGGLSSLSLVMRNGDTSIFSDGTLPSTPDPRLVTGYARSFQFCSSSTNNPNSCDLAEVDGTLEAVQALPEPASVALLAAGFAGVALTRRRKP